MPLQEVKQMLYAMRAPVPQSPSDANTPKRWRRSRPPFVVDIGANVGWFTLNAAAAGATVAAFEGAQEAGLGGGQGWLASCARHA
jgi:hypothetical protein